MDKNENENENANANANANANESTLSATVAAHVAAVQARVRRIRLAARMRSLRTAQRGAALIDPAERGGMTRGSGGVGGVVAIGALVACAFVCACGYDSSSVGMSQPHLRERSPTEQGVDRDEPSATPLPASDEDEAEGPVPPPPPEAADNPVSVVPVFFVASDARLNDADFRRYNTRVLRHLRITQRFYLSKLKTETFRTADKALVYHSNKPAADYGDPMTDPDPNDDIGNRKVREVLDWLKEDRFTSTHVFVFLFVRPNDKPCGGATAASATCLGFGRPFSGGPPVLGGGVVELDLSDLVAHETSPFQSTLAHELGHAFGLAHVDCHDYDMGTNDSIMSYNLAHHSHGYSESATPGILNPEDFFVLAQNKGVLPSFKYIPAVHNPGGMPLRNIDLCYLTPMNAGLGEALSSSPQGYRLFFDGQLRSGPETAYWVFARAKDNCNEMKRSYPDITVTCSFNGAALNPE